MKNIKAFFILLVFPLITFSQTTLSPGDIAITGFNADNPDAISFVILTDVLTSTVLNFTDNGWLLTGGFRVGASGNTNEGVLEWTATSDLTCGTEITITGTSASTGSVTETDASFALSATGDQILVYQGTTLAPNFILGISFDSTGWSDATSANTSALPSVLTDGENALSLGETDNGNYNCSVTNDASLILEATVKPLNWTISNAPITIGGCTYCCSTTTWTITGWNNGLPDLSKEAILMVNYDTNVNNDASFSACKLTINPGVKLTIRSNRYVEVQNDVTNAGEILIEDKGSFVQKSNTAVFINNNSTAVHPVIVDKVTAPLQEWYEYTYWSSPLENVAIGDLLPTTSASRLFEFIAANFSDIEKEDLNNNILVPGTDDIDDNADDWIIISNTTLMDAGRGYSATLAPIDLDLAGQVGKDTVSIKKSFRGSILNTGTINITANRNDEDTTNMDNNWNLIGNPYASAIDAKMFLEKNTYSATNTSGVLEGAIYFWSQETPPSAITNGNEPLNFDVNDYAILNLTSNTEGERYAPDNFIPSGQGFFASFSNDFPGTTGAVVFTNEMRVNGNNNQFFRNRTVDNKLWLNLTSDSDVFSQIAIGYVSGATKMNDGSLYDARRIFSGDSAMLFSTIENNENEFAIQGRAPEDITPLESIRLGITTAIDFATVYTLSIDHLQGEFMENETVYLRDDLMGIDHNLKASDYTFTSEVGIFKERFVIVFNEETLSNSDHTITEKSISIIEGENNNVSFTVNGSARINSIRILNLLGQEVYRFKGNKKVETYNLSNLSATVYVAQIKLSNGTFINKKVLKK